MSRSKNGAMALLVWDKRMLACFAPISGSAVAVAMPSAKKFCRVDATGPSTVLQPRNWKLYSTYRSVL